MVGKKVRFCCLPAIDVYKRQQLDSLKLESELKEKDFRITSYGATSLSKMSGEFIYTAYENGIPVRTFPIGPSCKHFTPLDSISPILRMSVMQSEDGAFFYPVSYTPLSVHIPK